MTTYSKSARSYSDIHQVFEKAGNLGKLELIFKNHAEAVTFASRANAYRRLLRQQNADAGREFACDFDHLMVRRPLKSHIITIEPRGFNFTAIGPDGAEVNLDKKTIDGRSPVPFERNQIDDDVNAFLESFGKAEPEDDNL